MARSLSAIVAYDRNRAIGNDGDMPWGRSLKTDLKNFQQLTLGNTVIMGRKTYQSIGKALPGRKTIVMSRNGSFTLSDATVCSSVDMIDSRLDGDGFVVGGGEIYALLEHRVSLLYATEIDAIFESDTFFEGYSSPEWSEISRLDVPVSDRDAYPFSFVRYTRNEQ